MTPETRASRAPELQGGTSARRFHALVAAYIHELSARHSAERDAGKARLREAEAA